MFRRTAFVLSLALLIAILAFGFLAGTGQTTEASSPAATPPKSASQQQVYHVERVTTAYHSDISPAVRDLPAAPTQMYTGSKVGEMPEGGPSGNTNPIKANGVTLDPVVQSILGPIAIPTPLVSFDGLSNISGVNPPDPDGDVGPNHYVHMTNLSFAVYTKAGAIIGTSHLNNTLWAGFGGPCQTSNSGDPIVLHDQMADRWILTQFTSGGPTYYQCVAVSTTADPTGTYYRYGFNMGNQFGDYPKYAVWPDAYYLSERDFTGGSTQNGQGLHALERAKMLTGDPTAQDILIRVPFTTPYLPGDGLLVADIDGSVMPPAGTPAFVVGSQDNGGGYGAPSDALNLWKFHVDFTTPANSTLTGPTVLPVAAFDSIFDPCGGGRTCIPQPGTTFKIDILSYRQRVTQRLSYRNMGSYQMLLTGQSVEAGTGPSGAVAGMRWYEIRDPNGTPTIYQQGTYAPGLTDSIHRWMGSLAMDGSGNIALGYSASDATSTFPSSAYTGRLAGDTLGQMTQGEAFFKVGTGSETGGGSRWGDYTAMHVDPTDDCTFWYVNEYIPTTSLSGWRGTIGSFKFPGCVAAGGTPTPTTTGTPPTATPTSTNTTAPTSTNTPIPPTATPTVCGLVVSLNEGFEGGTLGAFTNVVPTCVPGGCNWTSVASNPHTGTRSAFAPDGSNISDQYLEQTTGIVVSAGSTLSFWHSIDSEPTFDGGVLEATTNNGSTWTDMEPNILTGGYDGPISSSFGSPIAGRNAWNGSHTAYRQVTVNLTPYAGQSLRIRFRLATDSSVAAVGWNVDDVVISVAGACATNTPGPSPTNTSGATATPTGSVPTPTCAAGGSQVFNGALAAGDGTIAVRPFRDAIPSSCAVPKAFPGTTGTGPFYYDTYSVPNNTGSAQCVTITIDPQTCDGTSGTFLFANAYLGSFDPSNLATNYLADIGSSPTTPSSFSATVPAGQTLVVVVSAVTAGTGGACPAYTVTVDGLSGGCSTPVATNTAVATNTPGATPTCTAGLGTWAAGADLPSTLTRAYGAYFPANGKFYAVGGRTGDGDPTLAQVNPLEYNPATNTWVQKTAVFSDVQTSNVTGGVITVSGTPVIAIVGGSAGGGTGGTTEMRYYNPVADTMTTVATDPWTPGTTTVPGGSAVYNNKLYVFGGFVINVGMSNEIWEYDPAAAAGSRWTLKSATLPTALGYVPAATVGSFIYTIGGSEWDGTTLVDSAVAYKYDPVADTITAVASTPRATGETRAMAIDGKVWVLGGGRVAPNPGNQVEIYDPVANTYSSGPAFVTARRNFPVSTDGSKIYLAGGYDSSGTTLLASMEIYSPAACGTPAPTSTSGVTSTPTTAVTATDTTVPATATTEPTVTPTVCALQFTDVPVGSTFYDNIRCLACRGIINGYNTGCETGNPCFRPQNNVTRGQLAKIVSNSAGFLDPATTQQYEDVPVGSTFFDFVYRLTIRGYVNGYPCGGPGEPCGAGNLPYYRPNNNVTRGQLSKIVSNGAGLTNPAGAQQYEDVLPGSTFYDYIWRLTDLGVMNGYVCGGIGEPCVGPGNLPYFRPGANATRGQASKIVANTFFPGCSTPLRPKIGND